MYGGGGNYFNNLGIPSKSRVISKLTEIPNINVRDVRCVVLGMRYSILVMVNGDFMASGDSSVILGSGSTETCSTFTKIDVFGEMISWAAVGRYYSMYLTKSGRVFLHHKEIKERIEVELQNRALSVFGGEFYGGIIDNDGCAYFIDEDDPRKAPKRYEFHSPAVELVCIKNFKAVLLSDYKVYGNGRLNDDKDDFAQVSSLSDYKITKISGQAFSCLALSNEGLVFAFGDNNYRQFGDGTTTENYGGSVQMRIPGNERINDIAVCGHSLLLSSNGKLFRCGRNSNNQLFHKSENVLKVIQIDLNKRFSNIFVCEWCSIVISGVRIQENPAKSKFIKPKFDILQTRFDQTNQKFPQHECKNVFIYDFGARSLKVSLIIADGGLCDVVSHTINAEINSETIDKVIIQNLSIKLYKKYRVDPDQYKARIIEACELSKVLLCEYSSTEVELKSNAIKALF